MQALNEYFLLEVYKSCLTSKTFLEIIKPHLEYSYLPSAPYKFIYKFMFDYHSIHNEVPTLGQVAQNFSGEAEVTGILAKMREVNVTDKKDALLATMETYIKRAMFVQLHSQTAELYNKGEHEQAGQMMEERSEKLNAFSLRTKLYTQIFAGFQERQAERKSRDFSEMKIPTGIHAFDYHTYGGIEIGTALLVIARSGVGKSTALRWFAFSAALRGFNVVHFQAEGKKSQVEDAYDAMWTGVNVHKIKRGELNNKSLDSLEKSRQEMLKQCGEIHVIAYEQFDQASIAECRQHIIELRKQKEIHVAVFDYLEKFEPGDGKKYGTDDAGGRYRKLATAEKIVNIATEFNLAAYTATQANDIPYKDWNNPDFVLTRNNISNLRATIDAFAYCMTLNQTEDENDNDVLRIHEEKLREYKIRSKEATYKIAQARDVARFQDNRRTLEEFYDKETNSIILA